MMPRDAPRLAAHQGLAQHRGGELVDVQAGLERRDERVRAQVSMDRMTPARDRLRAADLARRERDLGLEERLELVRGEAGEDLVEREAVTGPGSGDCRALAVERQRGGEVLPRDPLLGAP